MILEPLRPELCTPPPLWTPGPIRAPTPREAMGYLVSSTTNGKTTPNPEPSADPPGAATVWLAARKELEDANYTDADDVTTVQNYGSLGGTLSAAGTGAVKFRSSSIGGQAAFEFNGSNRVESALSTQAFPAIAVAVVRVTGAATNQALFSVTDAFPNLYAYKNNTAARVAHYDTYPIISSTYPSTEAHAHGLYSAGKTAGDTQAVRFDASEGSASKVASFGADLNAVCIGASYGGVQPMTGTIAELLLYYGTAATDLITAAGSYSAAFTEIVDYLETIYGSFPVT